MDQASKPKESPKILAGSDTFIGAEFASAIHYAKTDLGIRKEHLLNPEYWSHVAELVRPYNEIKVRCEDGTYYGRLLVTECGRTWVKVRVLEWHDLTTTDVSMTEVSNAGRFEDYSIEWKGPQKKHLVTRNSDGLVVLEGESTKSGAEEWLRKFVAAPAAQTA